MADKCANPKCGKQLKHIEGRRKKKYCDQKCNSAHWQSLNYVPIKNGGIKFKKIPMKEWDEIQRIIKEFQRAGNENKFIQLDTKSGETELVDSPVSSESVAVVINAEQLIIKTQDDDYQTRVEKQRIVELRKELDNPPKSSIIGVKNWIKAREEELSLLKAKYNIQ